MASIFDVLGDAHVAVSNVSQMTGAIKLQVDAHGSSYEILSSLGQHARRIEQIISSLKNWADVSTLESEFFFVSFPMYMMCSMSSLQFKRKFSTVPCLPVLHLLRGCKGD